MNSGMFMGERLGKHLALAQGKLHTYVRGFLLLCSCVLLIQSGSWPVALPACPLCLAAVTGGVHLSLGFLMESLLEPDPLALSVLPITQKKWPSTCPASPPPHLGLFLRIPHPQSSIPCCGSVTALSTSLEEVSKSWETAMCWGAPAALSLVAGGDTACGSQGT